MKTKEQLNSEIISAENNLDNMLNSAEIKFTKEIRSSITNDSKYVLVYTIEHLWNGFSRYFFESLPNNYDYHLNIDYVNKKTIIKIFAYYI